VRFRQNPGHFFAFRGPASGGPGAFSCSSAVAKKNVGLPCYGLREILGLIYGTRRKPSNIEDSMDWLNGNFTGNHRIDHHIWVFLQIFPFNQFLDREIR